MSYSRWSNSFWYTFYAATDSDSKNNQIFKICDFGNGMSFTYKQLKDDIDKCLDQVVSFYKTARKLKLLKKEVIVFGVDITKKQLDELRGYMRTFIEEVEKEFPKAV